MRLAYVYVLPTKQLTTNLNQLRLNQLREKGMRNRIIGLIGAVLVLVGGTANAGNIYMTGHDVLLHSGQNSYDNVILEYLRNGSEPAASYNIGLFRTDRSGVGSLGVNTLEGFGALTQFTVSQGATVVDAAFRATFVAFLADVDVLVIPSHTTCGGCNMTSLSADTLEALSAEITDFFNAGGDIYANSAATDLTFYDFLPPGVATSGLPIGGSSGFFCTGAGNDIGITGSGCTNAGSNMINGFPTHNRFVDFDDSFTVFEIRGEEVISIGLLDGVIRDGGIDTDDDPVSVSEPGTLAMLGLGLLGLGAMRRRRRT
jgi:hypothetical protein